MNSFIITFDFASPIFLVLLPLLLLALVIGLRRRLPALRVPSLMPYQAAPPRPPRWSAVRLPLLIEAVGLAFLVVALLRPRHGIEQTVHRAEGIDLMLAIDVSGSMESVDLSPQRLSQAELRRKLARAEPRLEIAKQQVAAFIDRRPNDRIGLLAFAGRTYTVCPPTLDHDFVKLHLARLEPRMLDDSSTNIAAPIAIGTQRLRGSEAPRRVLVLFTDGANTMEDRVSPEQAARIARDFDVVLHTVGIGSRLAFRQVGGIFGPRWQRIPASFDDELLTQLAETTRGQYFHAEDAAGFEDVMQRIDALETTDFETPRYVDYRELFAPWLLAGSVLVLLGFAAEHTQYLKVP